MQPCPNCSRPNPAEAIFCMHCGTRLKAVCRHCSAPLVSEDAACPNCGRFLLAESADAGEAQAQEGRSAAAHLVGERRMVTILFADVVGSTSLAERMDPEAWTGVMNRAFDFLLPSIYVNGGTIARLMGDAVLAFFGAPAAREDDPVRAVKAAADLLRTSREYAAETRREHGIEFSMRVGINTGTVVVGEVGSYPMHEYTAMGDAVNVAQRMQAAARPDSVLLTERTYHLVSPWFECEDQGTIAVKGKSRTVRAYRLVGERSNGAQAQTRGLSSPMVGRAAQVAAFDRCLERLFQGNGAIVCVTGEAGVGKSRLLAEMRKSAAGRPLLWLEGQPLFYGRSTSYWPFQQILRQYTGIEEEDDPSRAWEKLEAKIGELFASGPGDSQAVSPPEVSPYLGSLLALKSGGRYAEKLSYLDAEALGKQIRLSCRRLFERLSALQPVILAMEDLHRIDESSARLLEHLMPLCEQVPLLICGLSRPDPEGHGAGLRELASRRFGQRYTEIPLSGLTPVDSAELARNLLGAVHLPRRFQEMIVDRAEGNPLFLEELIRILIYQKVITLNPGSGRWQISRKIDLFTVPNTIQGLISARLDRLQERPRQLLRIASVIGRSFQYRVLQAVDDSGQTLDWHLATLLQLGLIQERRREPELEYSFKHALVREATYDRILQHHRRELHRRVGRAMESVYGDRLEEFYGPVACHYAKAEAWDKAHEYLLKAGDQAGRMAADAEALAYYRLAMEAFGQAFGDRWDPLQRAVLKRKIAEGLFRRGRHADALANLVEALEDLGARLPEKPRFVRAAMASELLRQIFRRLTARGPSGSSAAVGAAVEETIRIYRTIGWIDIYTNMARFFWLVFRGLNLSERTGYAVGIAQSAAAVGYACDVLAAYRLARRYHDRALAMAESIGRPAVVGIARLSLGHHLYCTGDFPQAIELCRSSAASYREAGDLHGWGSAVQIIAYTLIYQGRFELAAEQCHALLRLGREGGEEQLLAWGLAALGALGWRMGELEQAEADLRESIAGLDRIPDHLRAARARIELARCLLRLGRPQEALSLLEQSRQLSSRYNLKGITVAPLYNALAELYLMEAQSSSRHGPEGARWLAKALRACRTAVKKLRAIHPLLPEALQLAGACYRLKGKHQKAGRLWKRGLALAESMSQAPVSEAIAGQMAHR